MSKYICFTKLKHLIFINGESSKQTVDKLMNKVWVDIIGFRDSGFVGNGSMSLGLLAALRTKVWPRLLMVSCCHESPKSEACHVSLNG
jgi:hypothetical protein